jgi:hypothetical protein
MVLFAVSFVVMLSVAFVVVFIVALLAFWFGFLGWFVSPVGYLDDSF